MEEKASSRRNKTGKGPAVSWIGPKEAAIGLSPGAGQLCGQDSGRGSQVAGSQLAFQKEFHV